MSLYFVDSVHESRWKWQSSWGMAVEWQRLVVHPTLICFYINSDRWRYDPWSHCQSRHPFCRIFSCFDACYTVHRSIGAHAVVIFALLYWTKHLRSLILIFCCCGVLYHWWCNYNIKTGCYFWLACEWNERDSITYICGPLMHYGAFPLKYTIIVR